MHGEERLVLVVEDNLSTAAALARLLKLRKYRVVTAYDGLDAMEMLRAGLRPAVIVLDLWMPNLNGPEFRSELLADPELARIPVIVYSVDAEKEELPQVVGYVRKAFYDPAVLLDLIETACDRGRSPG
jgi:CheY-like chemotaxis protein